MAPAAKPMQELIPPAGNQPLSWIENAGHLIQEDAGEELAERILSFADRTSR